MRKFCLGVFLVLATLAVSAGPITRRQAQQKAEDFMSRQSGWQQLSPVTSASRLAPGRKMASDVSEYYVFNKGQNQGYVIVSGDDQTEPILGYCDEGEFDYDRLPPAMQEWLDDYARQIELLQRDAVPPVGDAVPTHAKVEPLMKSKWSQGYPYNLTCPQYFTLGQSVTGCVATAMAQLLYYNREKSVSETTAAMPPYDTWTEHATYGRLHVEGIPEGAPIDWENMKDEYGSANEKQRRAVADLMHYCGVAVKMDYTNSSSGAQSYDAYLAFGKYFGYGSSVRYVSYQNVTSDVEWDRIVYNEISSGRPIYISGSNSEAGHAFCADGYDGNLRYHINWGWGGTSDGYYMLTQLTPGQQGIGGSNDGYNAYREIIIGLEPENYGEKAMSFSDATVKKICIDNWDANGDGQLTYGEASAISDLGTAFQGTTIKSFKELYYFNSVTQLPDDAFNGCSQLALLRLPKNIQSIGARALKDCAKLSQLDLPNHVKTIGTEAFAGCASLSSLSLPEELPAIADGTFRGSGLTSMLLPITVGSIGAEAFANCAKLASFEVRTFQPDAISLDPTAFAGTGLQAATLRCLQGTKAYFASADVWKTFGSIVEQRERSAGQFAELEVNQTYYLYHVGTGKYLTKGEAWGTQAIVGDTPMRFTIKRAAGMPEGVYYLSSEDTGKDGKYLFRTSTDANVGNGIVATFVDGTSLNAMAYWAIQAVADKVYTIQIPKNGTAYAEGNYWGVQTDHRSNAASPTYGLYADVVYDEHPANCQWRLVAYDAEQAQRYDAALTLGNLIDIARPRRLSVAQEQAVFDNLESTYDQLRAAQCSLRKKLGFIDFASSYVGKLCVSSFDLDSDGELSIVEASKVSDLPWGFYFALSGNTTVTTFDELRYFTSIPSIYGNTFENCTNLESISLPKNLENIYYNAFTNCRKLKSINLPEYVTQIGPNVFKGCTALREVTVMNPDPSAISVGEGCFSGVSLKECVLRVPFGSKDAYAEAEVWKEFGQIVEVRGHTQPRLSPIAADVPGYVYHLETRRYVAMGEAYGTQSVVARKGLVYQFKHTKSMADGVYYLHSDQTGKDGKVLFRTDTDTKVGDGVKTCFGDGTISTRAYWKLDSVAPCVYQLKLPETDASYVDGQALGIEIYHQSQAAYPTYGLYYDVYEGKGTQWGFVTKADYDEALLIDTQAEELAEVLERAREADIDVDAEQAVYDNPQSTAAELRQALVSVRAKMHYITFADDKARSICLQNWDGDGDGELTFEEAASVETIGELFRGANNLKTFDELRYFTSLRELPANAFRSAMSLQSITLPAGITGIGEYAFTGCSLLRYIVLLGEQNVIPLGFIGVPNNSTLFVPASMLAAYQADSAWSTRCTVTEYTGQPRVTAVASRQYGRKAATIKASVLGAPITGEPEFVCEAVTDATLPVGQYPIAVLPGTISTAGVELFDGILTVEPAPLTVTAQSYTRQVGQPNPEFELTFKGFRNRETDTVFTVRPVVTCEATLESPAGEYEIKVSGGETRNYVLTYVSGTLTVEADASGIRSVESTRQPAAYYDLQGRRIAQPRRGGVYLKGKRKLLVK